MIEIRNGGSTGLLYHHQGLLHIFQHVCVHSLSTPGTQRGARVVWHNGKSCAHLRLLWPRSNPRPGAVHT